MDGDHSPGGLRSVAATVGVTAVLLAWFPAARWLAWRLDAGTATWLLAARSPFAPAPGWLLAPVTHLTVDHLVSNVAALVVFGAVAEPHLAWRQYLGLFAIAGVGSALAEGATSSPDRVALGASGATLALATFLAWHYFRDHDRGARGAEGEVAPVVAWIAAALVALVGTRSLLNLLVGPTAPSTVGHLFGVLVGATWALVQPVLGRPCARPRVRG